MDRRNFLKLPLAGAVLLPAAAMAKELAVPEKDLEIVQAWAVPSPAKRPNIELVAKFPSAIVAMTVHQGKLFVATAEAMYVVDQDAMVGDVFTVSPLALR